LFNSTSWTFAYDYYPAVLVSTGKKLHKVTQKYKVPLLINDRIDVALAVGCEGVHIGQDDLGMPGLVPLSVVPDQF
jgi:thiamine monophosphate synthase